MAPPGGATPAMLSAKLGVVARAFAGPAAATWRLDPTCRSHLSTGSSGHRQPRHLLRPRAVLRQARRQEHVRVLRLGPLGPVVARPASRWSPRPSAATRQTWSPTSSAATAWRATGCGGRSCSPASPRCSSTRACGAGRACSPTSSSTRSAIRARPPASCAGFRAVYLGLFFNCMIMATVNLAACKIAAILFGLPRWQTLVFVGLLNVAFAAHSGLWGVLVIDMMQFFVMMTAVIAAAYFALQRPAGGRAHGAGREALDAARPGRTGLPGGAAGLHQQLGPGAGGLHHAHRRAMVGGAGTRARSRAAAATSRSACWPRSPRRTRSARCCSSTSRTTCCGRGRGSSSALASLLVYPELSDIQRAFPDAGPDRCSATTSPTRRCSSSCRSASSA